MLKADLGQCTPFGREFSAAGTVADTTFATARAFELAADASKLDRCQTVRVADLAALGSASGATTAPMLRRPTSRRRRGYRRW